MLRNHALIARAVALGFCLATAGCADTDDQAIPAMATEIEEPLTLTVDHLDVRHGGLRVEATMLDGSADVSMWLGSSCPEEEVGRGIATRSGFAWSLSADDVGRAIECNLVVKSRGVNQDGLRVVKTAALDVGLSLVADGAETAQLVSQSTAGEDTTLSFATAGRASYLHVGGSVIGAEEEEEETVTSEGFIVSAFVVSNTDLARSLLRRGHVSVRGETFLATLTIGSQTLGGVGPVEPVAQPTVIEGPSEGENPTDMGDG